ncbi:hypothetical protein WKI13_04750 [Teredinibacter turnerae]|uniref:hypothetical protein n=1 Tax=Teredinibacter turnerae TaxID=2426 RepID=UPI00037E07D0|nr:hypothetical protein [Teredinibacter turnerae]
MAINETISEKINEEVPESSATKQSIPEARASIDDAVVQFKAAARSAREAARTMGFAVSSDAQGYYEDGKAKANEASEKAMASAREKPLMVAGISFAAGFLVSRLLKVK